MPIINFANGRPSLFTNYTIMSFSDWRALEEFAKIVEQKKPSAAANKAKRMFEKYVNDKINGGTTINYGLFGKHPKSFQEAFERNTFLYYDEYKKIKEEVLDKIRDYLQKSSTADVMKPRMVYNDKQLGEFIFERAAMSLEPEIYLYSPSKKREIDTLKEKIIYEGNKMFLESDKSPVVNALKIETSDGIEYQELNGEESLIEASKKGVVVCTSGNKKVYLYKEKKPKTYNAIKIIVGMTNGGWTSWDNDFYTGICAACCVDVLESLGYSVHVEVVMGGGRCGSSVCGGLFPLKFSKSNDVHGRRYFSFTAKSFDSQGDFDGLLYTLCDPSFHNIKFISYLNNFMTYFGDAVDTSSNPTQRWHGIEEEDMKNPIGMYFKYMDYKKQNDNVLHFYIHKVPSEQGVIAQIKDIIDNCENLNLEAIKKYQTHDFGID